MNFVVSDTRSNSIHSFNQNISSVHWILVGRKQHQTFCMCIAANCSNKEFHNLTKKNYLGTMNNKSVNVLCQCLRLAMPVTYNNKSVTLSIQAPKFFFILLLFYFRVSLLKYYFYSRTSL